MKNFYIIENDKVSVGTGLEVPDGAVEYKVGEEPKDLLEALRCDKEEQRILSIKAKAEQLITAKYPIIWQLNHPRLDESYKDDYAYIDRIRDISNEAETDVTLLEDIVWN